MWLWFALACTPPETVDLKTPSGDDTSAPADDSGGETGGGTGDDTAADDTGDPLDPGCGRIVFRSSRTGGGDVYVMDADGSNVTRVTALEDDQERNPTLSPDCSRVVYAGLFSGELRAVSVDGTGDAVLLPVEEGVRWKYPNWSPDGAALVVTRESPEGSALYRLNPDGTGLTALTDPDDGASEADWHPDGDRLVYRRTAAGATDIAVLDLETGDSTLLTDDLSPDTAPRWSPDGALITWQSGRSSGMAVHLMGADGTDIRRLTADADPQEERPAFSPDATHLVFHSTRDGDEELYRVRPDGTDLVNLSEAPDHDENEPQWR